MRQTDTSLQKIDDILRRGVAEAITRESAAKKLASGKVLRVKHGVDPSGNELHLGHAAVYLKLRDLQEMGHRVVFLIGGFTGRFGDPTDKLRARTLKTKKETEAEAKTYIKQIEKLLDTDRLEIRTNSEWYDRMGAEELLKIMSNFTVDHVLERDMFRERKRKNEPIRLHEIVYPVLQGYDSVMLKSDLTVIGTDQVFNEGVGRDLQKNFGQEAQDIVAVKVLAGLDGRQKMGKSMNNYIALADAPKEQFGKIMSLPDHLIIDYFTLLTRLPMREVEEMALALKEKRANPKNIKIKLAREIVRVFHSSKEAEAASLDFEKTFSKKGQPTGPPIVETAAGALTLLDLVVVSGLVKSKSEARRLITGGAVDVNQETKKDCQEKINISDEVALKIGKHRFVKIIKKHPVG